METNNTRQFNTDDKSSNLSIRDDVTKAQTETQRVEQQLCISNLLCN